MEVLNKRYMDGYVMSISLPAEGPSARSYGHREDTESFASCVDTPKLG